VTGREDFAAFFRQDFPRLVLFLIKNGASEADAEDAAQEAMTKASTAWARIDNPRAWVRTVALRIWWKQAGWDAVLDEDAPLLTREDPTATEEEKWKVVQLLRRLPPAQRAVAALYYDGFSTKEISGILSKTEGTIRSLLRYGRRRLKEMIGSDDDPEATDSGT
jgi:RNA polymerase sigma-70 factor (ECF subfamily)